MNNINTYLHKLNQFSEQIKYLLDTLKNSTIKHDRHKENKHRPLNSINDYYIKISDGIDFICENNKITKIEIYFKEKNKNQKKFKNKRKTHYLKKTQTKKSSTSIYKINANDELNLIIKNYEDELNEINGIINLLNHLISNYDNKYKLFATQYFYEFFKSNYKIKNRIYYSENDNSIQNIFPKTDFTKILIFSPPKNMFSTNSIVYNNVECVKTNAYIYVKNSKNEYHLFYGYFEFIDKKQKINDINKIVEELFNSHIIQNGYRLPPMFKSCKIEIGKYSYINEYNEQLSKHYCEFLKIYYHQYKIIDIKPSIYTPNKFINNILEFGKTISGIKITIVNNNNFKFDDNNLKYYVEHLDIKNDIYDNNNFIFELYKMNDKILKELLGKL